MRAVRTLGMALATYVLLQGLALGLAGRCVICERLRVIRERCATHTADETRLSAEELSSAAFASVASWLLLLLTVYASMYVLGLSARYHWLEMAAYTGYEFARCA
jgi:hypothetical protein